MDPNPGHSGYPQTGMPGGTVPHDGVLTAPLPNDTFPGNNGIQFALPFATRPGNNTGVGNIIPFNLPVAQNMNIVPNGHHGVIGPTTPNPVALISTPTGFDFPNSDTSIPMAEIQQARPLAQALVTQILVNTGKQNLEDTNTALSRGPVRNACLKMVTKNNPVRSKQIAFLEANIAQKAGRIKKNESLTTVELLSYLEDQHNLDHLQSDQMSEALKLMNELTRQEILARGPITPDTAPIITQLNQQIMTPNGNTAPLSEKSEQQLLILRTMKALKEQANAAGGVDKLSKLRQQQYYKFQFLEQISVRRPLYKKAQDTEDNSLTSGDMQAIKVALFSTDNSNADIYVAKPGKLPYTTLAKLYDDVDFTNAILDKTDADMAGMGEALLLIQKGHALEKQNKDLERWEKERLLDHLRKHISPKQLRQTNFDNRSLYDGGYMSTTFEGLDTRGASFQNTRFKQGTSFKGSRFSADLIEFDTPSQNP